MSNGTYCRDYPELMNQFKKFKFPDKNIHDEQFHDDLVDAYCVHLERVLEDISANKDLNLEIINRRDKKVTEYNRDQNKISNLSNTYNTAIKNNKIPAMMIKNIDYVSEFSGTFPIGTSDNDGLKIKDSIAGQIDGMLIIPLQLFCDYVKEEDIQNSYCLLIETKSSYRLGSNHRKQLESAAYSCIYPHLKKPFDIKYIDGILVTPKLTERTFTHKVKCY